MYCIVWQLASAKVQMVALTMHRQDLQSTHDVPHCKDGIYANQTNLNLIKFIMNIINIYGPIWLATENWYTKDLIRKNYQN